MMRLAFILGWTLSEWWDRARAALSGQEGGR